MTIVKLPCSSTPLATTTTFSTYTYIKHPIALLAIPIIFLLIHNYSGQSTIGYTFAKYPKS
jgi:hypothetical protein